MAIENRPAKVPEDSGAADSLPSLPATFSSEVASGATGEERRRLIRRIIVGVPAVVAMTARGAMAQGGGPSDPSVPSGP